MHFALLHEAFPTTNTTTPGTTQPTTTGAANQTSSDALKLTLPSCLDKIEELLKIQQIDPNLFTDADATLNLENVDSGLLSTLSNLYSSEMEVDRTIFMNLFAILKDCAVLSYQFPQAFRIFASQSEIPFDPFFKEAIQHIYSVTDKTGLVSLKKYLEWIRDGCKESDKQEVTTNFWLFKKLVSYYHDPTVIKTIIDMNVQLEEALSYSNILAYLRNLQIVAEYCKLLDKSTIIAAGIEDYVKGLTNLRDRVLSHIWLSQLVTLRNSDTSEMMRNLKTDLSEFLKCLQNYQKTPKTQSWQELLLLPSTLSQSEITKFLIPNLKGSAQPDLKDFWEYYKISSQLYNELEAKYYKDLDKHEEILNISEEKGAIDKNNNEKDQLFKVIYFKIKERKKQLLWNHLINNGWKGKALPSESLKHHIEKKISSIDKKNSFPNIMKQLNEIIVLDTTEYNWFEPTNADETFLHKLLGLKIDTVEDKRKYRLEKLAAFITIINEIRGLIDLDKSFDEIYPQQSSSKQSKKLSQVNLYKRKRILHEDCRNDRALIPFKEELKTKLTKNTTLRSALEFLICAFYENFSMVSDWPELIGIKNWFEEVRNYYNHLYVGGREDTSSSAQISESNDINDKTATEAIILSVNVFELLQQCNTSLANFKP